MRRRYIPREGTKPTLDYAAPERPNSADTVLRYALATLLLVGLPAVAYGFRELANVKLGCGESLW